MHLFFGNGNNTFVNDDGIDLITTVGNTSFSSHGIMNNISGMSFLPDGKMINRNGNMYFCGNHTYSCIGNSIIRDDGKLLNGFGHMSDQTMRNAIFSDQSKNNNNW